MKEIEAVTMLLNETPADPSFRINYAVHAAIEKKNVPMVKLLVSDVRVDVTKDDDRLLRSAMNSGGC
jgi:hypothetical protein